MPKYLGDVRCWVNSGKHMLAWSFSGFDPTRTSARVDPARGSDRFKRLKVLTTARFYEAQPHIAAGFHAWHFNGNLKACVGWRGGAICIVSDGSRDGSLIRKSKSNGRQTRAKLLGHLSARPGPEARVGSLATVSGLHLEATPSLLNLGLCRAFAACPCLCNRNGVLRDVVADHHARRASDKASLWPLFGDNLRG